MVVGMVTLPPVFSSNEHRLSSLAIVAGG
ncbi:MAG: hypothetical protein RL295_1212, partial [Pseudomonadota bacterium]